jgi:DUF1680 family protein
MNTHLHAGIRFLGIGLALGAFVTGTSHAVEPTQDYLITEVPVRDVNITGGFWRQRLDTHFATTLGHVLKQCEETGRLENFEIAAGVKKGEFQGSSFNDSDVYKIVEGMSWSEYGPMKQEQRDLLENFVGLLAKAQLDDGYLFTYYQTKDELGKRWSDIDNMHELYCAGHLFEAASARYRMTGKRDLLEIGLKFADLIGETFGPGKIEKPPGHQEIEMALADFYRITGNPKYLDLARYFLEQRGARPANWYHQDHKPLLKETEAVGHAVRAVYGYCGMAEVAALTGDKDYLTALDSYWNSVTGSKMAVSGSIGGGLWEAFDKPYFLPNRSAYNETCGSIAQVLWNHRMFRLTGDGKYLDVLERALYNGVLTGEQLSGDAFFYPNALETGPVKRQPWFGCACCPSNIARIIPAQSGYLYATAEDTLFACLYADSESTVKMAGAKVGVVQKTAYPWDGKVAISLKPSKPTEFTLAMRIPGWAVEKPVPGDLYHYLGEAGTMPTLMVNGEPVKPEISKGFAHIKRTWKAGDTVTLDLPMEVRELVANEQVKDDRGRLALERGPLVYCVEGVDNGGLETPQNVLIDSKPSFEAVFQKDLLGGITTISTNAALVKRGQDGKSVEREPRQITAIPYFARANRTPSSMAVFVLRDADAAALPPVPSLATAARKSASTGQGNFAALCDQIAPARSADASHGVFGWDGRDGTTEWVQYDFDGPQPVSSSTVYWYDRFGTAQRLPKAWRLLYRDGADWKPVVTKDSYGVATDTSNTVRFEPVKTDALRLEADLQDAFLDPYLAAPDAKPSKFSAGILEWSVE